jgi:hypothetical protein
METVLGQICPNAEQLGELERWHTFRIVEQAASEEIPDSSKIL